MDSSKQTSLLKQLALCILVVGGVTSAQAMDPLSAINKANSSILQWRVVGVCSIYPPRIRVEHWIPLAWVETSPSGDSSLISGLSSRDGKSSLIRQSGLESSSSVRVLDFTTPLWKLSNLALTHLDQVCRVEDAHAPAIAEPFGMITGCDGQNIIENAMSQLDGVLQVSLLGLMTVAYDSTKDSGWLSGCRDKSKVDHAVAENLRCTTDMLDASLQPGGANPLLESKNCVGKWGSLYPRQARDIGPTGPIASVKAAYRALSTARDQLGRIQYPIDTNGKFQQSFPSVSSSFQPGDKPLPANASMSTERQYGWIYWRKVRCCVR